MTKRLTVFSFFDPNNEIDEYVIHYLKELNKVSDVIFSADCNLNEFELLKLSGLTLFNLHSKHGEYDFGSYKHGFLKAKKEKRLDNYDWLILANDSCYGPFQEFLPIFSKMENQNLDFWGFTHNTIDSTPHIQSYFTALNKKVFNSDVFAKFILGIQKQTERKLIISKYEHGLTKKLSESDFKYNTVLEEQPYRFINDPANNWDSMIDKGYPFIKRTLFTRNPYNLKNIFNYKKVIKSKFPLFDSKLIENNLNKYKASSSIVVYTTIFDSKTALIEQPKFEGVDYICYTNQPLNSKGWMVINLKDNHLTSTHNSLLTEPHKHLSRYETSIYIDPRYLILRDFSTIINVKFKESKSLFAWENTNLYSFPSILIRKHNNPVVIESTISKTNSTKGKIYIQNVINTIGNDSVKEIEFLFENPTKYFYFSKSNSDLKKIKQLNFLKKILKLDTKTINQDLLQPTLFFLKLPYLLYKTPLWYKKISKLKISKTYYSTLRKLILRNKMQRKEIRDYIRRN